MRSAGLELPSDPIGCSPRGSAMKRPLYYLLCAIACTSMVSATMLWQPSQKPYSLRQQPSSRRRPTPRAAAQAKLKTAPTQIRQQIPLRTAPQHPPTPAQSTRKAPTAPPPHPSEPRPTPRPRQSPPRHKPATPTPPPQPKTASPSTSRGTTPPRALRRPST